MSHSCDPMDCTLPGSFVHGISQAGIQEWVAISFSRGSSQPRDRNCLLYLLHCRWVLYWLCYQRSPKVLISHVRLFVTPWIVARLFCPWNSPGKNTGVSSHCLLQGTFLTQGSNPSLLPCRQILYHLSHQGIPRYHYTPTRKGYIPKNLTIPNVGEDTEKPDVS